MLYVFDYICHFQSTNYQIIIDLKDTFMNLMSLLYKIDYIIICDNDCIIIEEFKLIL